MITRMWDVATSGILYWLIPVAIIFIALIVEEQRQRRR